MRLRIIMARLFRVVALAPVLIVIFTGCASKRLAAGEPVPLPLEGDLPVYKAPADLTDRHHQGQVHEEPQGELSLRDALALTLLKNPELAAFSWEIRAREAQALQSRVRTNPELTLGVENFAGGGQLSGFEGSETTVTLSQLVELGGKRQKRHKVARFDREIAEWEYESRRIGLFAETAGAFVEVLLAQKQVLLADELAGVAERILRSVSKQVEAGAASPVEENRARVALETSRIDSIRAGLDLSAARKTLSSAWGGTDPRFTRAVGDLEEITSCPPLEHLLSAASQNPRLARSRAELELSRAELQLERAIRLPDVTVGAGIRRFAEIDESALVFELGVSLPFFDRNQEAAQAAAYRLAKALEEGRFEELQIRTELSIVYDELTAAGAEARALRDRILPEAEKAFAKAQDAYRRGLLRFTDVLDTERTLFELRGRYFAALARYHKSVASAEALTGEPLFGSTEH